MSPSAEPVPAPVHDAIALEGVTAGYADEAPALVAVSVTLAPGATLVVHGGAGAGKTTLLHVMRTALAPVEGAVRLLGSDVARLPVRLRRALKQRIGYIAQTPRLLDDVPAFDNIALPLNLAGAPDDGAAADDVQELIVYLGLADTGDRPVGALSDAQRRLVAIARAVVGRPDILLADEPLAGLGPDAMARVLRLVSELARQRAAVVVATQNAETFAALAATRRYLERGRLAA